VSRSEARISLDRSRCVLCGEPNECALARDQADAGEPCWCVGQSFPRTLRVRATEQDGGESCICRRCLEKADRDSSGS
jgi:hypothetical protein